MWRVHSKRNKTDYKYVAQSSSKFKPLISLKVWYGTIQSKGKCDSGRFSSVQLLQNGLAVDGQLSKRFPRRHIWFEEWNYVLNLQVYFSQSQHHNWRWLWHWRNKEIKFDQESTALFSIVSRHNWPIRVPFIVLKWNKTIEYKSSFIFMSPFYELSW